VYPSDRCLSEAPVTRTEDTRFQLLYGAVACAGAAVAALALYRVVADRTPPGWVALALLAAAAGSFSLKIPGINGRVSAGDTIACLSILLFGPYAGALTAAGDAVAGSMRCRSRSRRWRFALYNAASYALSAFLVGHATLGLLGKSMLHDQPGVPASELLLPLCVLAGGYYVMNTVLVAAAVALEKSRSLVDTWRDGFMWTCANYLAGAWAAGFLVQAAGPLSIAQLAVVLLSCSGVYVTCRAHVRLAAAKQRT